MSPTTPRDTRPAILLLHPSAEGYGADRTLLDLVAGTASSFRSVVVLPRRGSLAPELEAAGAQVEIAPLGIGGQGSLSIGGLRELLCELPRSIAAIRRIARQQQVELVHTNTMVVLGGAIAAWTLPIPHVWHVHEIPTRRWLTRGFAKLFDWFADRVVTNSAATREHFVAERRKLEDKCEVVWNGTLALTSEGTPAQSVDGPRAATRAQLGVPPGAVLVALVGRINSWKGHSLLLEAARVRRNQEGPDPQVHYALVGDAPPGQGHFEVSLDKEIEEAGLEDVVTRCGFLPDPRAIFEAADLVVVPSTRPEPFGLVAIEAMACGKPVIAAAHGGLSEIVLDGVTGRLFEPNNAAALADTIQQLAADPGKALRMGRAGRARQREHFAVETYQEAFCGLYSREIDTRQPRTSIAASPGFAKTSRIIHLVLGKANPARMNGVNVAVHYLSDAQAKLGMDVELWGMTETPHSEAVKRAFPTRFFPRSRSRFRLCREVRRAILETTGPTLFHLHGGFLPEMWAAARLLRKAGIPYVFTPHGSYRRAALAHRRLAKRVYLACFERSVLRGARAMQAFAIREAEEAKALARKTPVVTLPNGQALGAPPRSALSQGRGERTSGPTYLYCGRLDVHTKGLDLLLEGFAKYTSQGGIGSLHIVGDGPQASQMRSMTTQLGIAERTRFFGAQFGDLKLALLNEADLFALTSRHEGMPTAPLEAAARGCALLVSQETNLADEVREANCGYTLEANDPQAIAAALWAADRAWRSGELETLGQRARSMVEERFAWDQIALRAAHILYELKLDTPLPSAA